MRSKLTRHDFGLDTPRGEWLLGARCAQSDVDMDWWTGGREQGLARHVCWMHCPVRVQCQADTPTNPDHRRGTVYGGFAYNFGGKLVADQPGVLRCPLCLPAQQRRELAEAAR